MARRKKKIQGKPSSLADLPQVPAVYALCGGSLRGRYVAYVGTAQKLRRRIDQHLIGRDSSVAVGTSASGINPDYVTEVRWWEHRDFRRKDVLEAAGIVATEVLNPVLRSRARTSQAAKNKLRDEGFGTQMAALFQAAPTGHVPVPSLASLDARLRAVEKELASLKGDEGL